MSTDASASSPGGACTRRASVPQCGTSHCESLTTPAVFTAAADVGALDLSRRAHAAGNDVLRAGMIGPSGRNAGVAVFKPSVPGLI